MSFEKVVLAGPRVRLEPLAEEHLPGLAAAIADGALWEMPVTTIPHPDGLAAFLQAADSARMQRELAFAIIDAASGTIVGSTRYRHMELAHRRVEIGNTFLAASWQGIHVNTESKLLMLRHAFEHWGCNRVEFMTDELNIRSRNAIARLGAREEGVLRSHMVMRGGRVRDSVLFSITAAELPQVKSALEQRIQGAG